MYSYFVYGLGIRSTLQLPELESGEQESMEHGAWSREQGAGSGEHRARSLEQESKGQSAKGKAPGAESSDVKILFGRVERLPPGAAVEGSYFRVTSGETQLFWEDVGTIQVRGGCEIIVDPVPGVEEALLRLVILGPALGALLQQREHLVLHGSAVAIAGGAVAFLGDKGWGKSTVAGVFYSRGYSIAADDIVPVHVGTGCPVVHTGFPQLKLWPDTAVSLGYALETMPRLHSRLDKRAQRVDRGFSQAPLPLRAIYLLAQGEILRLEPLASRNALLELVRHSYRPELLRASGASWHFLQCASIAKSTRIRYLRVPRSLSALPDLARLVEQDLTGDKSEYTVSSPAP